MGALCVAGASVTLRRKASNGDGERWNRGGRASPSRPAEKLRKDDGDDPAADSARGDDWALREPADEPPSEAPRGEDWAEEGSSAAGPRLNPTTGGMRRRRKVASSAVDMLY